MNKRLSKKLINSYLIPILFINFLFSGSLKSQLKSTDNKADYIIIYSNLFSKTLMPFIQWRENQGLDVMNVDIDQIYTEFLDTLARPQAIREFISYALNFWQKPNPRYILLVGDTEYVPSYRIESSFEDEDSVSIDELFTIDLYDDDTEPDVSLGRLPVKNNNQLSNIISKTMFFEEGLIYDNWMEKFIFLADSSDDPNYPRCFENTVMNFINNNLPEYLAPIRIDIRENSPYHGKRQELFTAINSGALFFSYYGHGEPTFWSRYHYFTINDIDSLDENNRFFILTSAACSQNFDNPYQESIVEELIFFPNGGAVATLASSGSNNLGTSDVFLRYFYEQLFTNQKQTIGESILEVKKFLMRIGGDTPLDHQFRRFTLFGDPYLKIPFYLISNIEMENHTNGYQFSLNPNYPNPFNNSTIIPYELRKSNKIILKIYDLTGREISVLINQWREAGKYQVQFVPNNISSGVYLYQLTSDKSQLARKFIYIK